MRTMRGGCSARCQTEAAIKAMRHVKPVRELIRAWDPVAGKAVWEHETSSGIRGYDGGVMSTGGNLVFQGRGSGELWVYAADTGKVLKVIKTGSHIMAAPMTYAINGEQYVAVQVGYGGSRDHRGTDPTEQRRPQIPEYQPHHCLQIGRRRGADAAATRGTAAARAPEADRDASTDRCRRNQVHRAMHALSPAGSEQHARTCADSTMVCMSHSRTSS